MAALRSSVRKILVICDVDDVMTSKAVVEPLAGPIRTLLLLADRDIHGVDVEFDVVIDVALVVMGVTGVVEIVLFVVAVI